VKVNRNSNGASPESERERSMKRGTPSIGKGKKRGKINLTLLFLLKLTKPLPKKSPY
jgi:hypothetical protein